MEKVSPEPDGLKSFEKSRRSNCMVRRRRKTHRAGFFASGLIPSRLILDTAYDLAVRAGLHCAALAHRTLGTFPEGTVRVSPGFFNREGEIEDLIRAVSEIAGKV
jgi:hypothetical protein